MCGVSCIKNAIPFFPVYSTRQPQHTTRGREWLGTWFLNWVLKQKKRSVSLSFMPTPQVWFKLQPHVCDGNAGGVLNRLRAGDAGLGNRRPNIHGSTTKWCPLCLSKGLVSHLSESHVVVFCQAVAYERSASGLGALMTDSTRSGTTVLTRILGGDNASREVLLR